MIDFDTSRRPGRHSEWVALVTAVHASEEPEESYWLELKSSLDWSKPQDVGNLARAILGLANRDPNLAGGAFGGSGIVIVGISPRELHEVEVLDPADLENKLTPFLGTDGPRWQPYWVRINDLPVLVVEVDAPKNGDPGYTLRARFGDYRASQMFVRERGKTVIADQGETERLARRMVASNVQDSLDVMLGFSLDEPLATYFHGDADIDAFVRSERDWLLASLERVEAEEAADDVGDDFPGLPGVQSAISSIQRATILSSLIEKHEETRTPDEFRAEVTTYIENLHEQIADALRMVANRAVPIPRFWLSNLSKRNFKDVEVTIRVEGEAVAEDASDERIVSIRRWLPRRPRKFGPYTTTSSLAAMLGGGYNSVPYIPSIPYGGYGSSRRDIRNGGSFVVDFDAIDLRPGDNEIPVESELVILIPRHREEAVVVNWQATASNVDAIAKGAFVLPFEGEPLDLLALGLDDDEEED